MVIRRMKIPNDGRTLISLFAFAALVGGQQVCHTPSRQAGLCIALSECQSFNDYFKSDRILNLDEITFLEKSRCSSNPPKICCPDRLPARPSSTTEASSSRTSLSGTTSTSTTESLPQTVTSAALLPDPKMFECGIDIVADRIFGGQDTTLREFPWFALLNYENKKGQQAFKCGGSLINRRYILTAAHCLDNSHLDGGERFVNVRLGDYNTATDTDCEDVDETMEQLCANPPQNIDFEEIIIHPGYAQNDSSQHHDIALIRLARDAEINLFVTPICLPDEEFEATQPGRKAVIAGFGHTGRSRNSGIKQKAEIPIIDQEICRNKWSSITLDDRQLCAGAEFGIDSCTGDSGGPLMAQKFYWVIEGLVSFGHKCGLEGWPGIYTRVSSYVDWIKGSLRP